MANTQTGAEAERLTQPSTVKFVGRNDGLSGMETYWFVPLSLNACPTLPLVNVTPLSSVPLLVPATSLPLPSAGHQLTSPEGAGVEVGGGVTGTHLPAPSAL